LIAASRVRVEHRRAANAGRENDVAQGAVVGVVVCGVICHPERSTAPGRRLTKNCSIRDRRARVADQVIVADDDLE
jgi:hypothetical protein